MLFLKLAHTLAVVFYVLPLNGEMCSTMISAVDGKNLSALQKRACSSFRSTCRREAPLQSKEYLFVIVFDPSIFFIILGLIIIADYYV